MTELAIRVHGVPAPQGSKRHVGNGVMVESSKRVKPWREAVKYAALDALGTDAPIPGPVCLGVTFLLPRPKGHYRTGRNAHMLREGAPWYPAGKPDLDKLLRSTMDGLGEAAVWRDDSQVVRIEKLVKIYADPRIPGADPGAVIRLHPANRTRVGDDHAAAVGDREAL